MLDHVRSRSFWQWTQWAKIISVFLNCQIRLLNIPKGLYCLTSLPWMSKYIHISRVTVQVGHVSSPFQMSVLQGAPSVTPPHRIWVSSFKVHCISTNLSGITINKAGMIRFSLLEQSDRFWPLKNKPMSLYGGHLVSFYGGKLLSVTDCFMMGDVT